MKTFNPYTPADCSPVHWQEIKRTTDRLFDFTMPGMLRQVGVFINPDDIDFHRARLQDEFHISSAGALELDRSSYEISAATRRIEWRRADSSSLHPPCQIRIDAGDWINLTFPPHP